MARFPKTRLGRPNMTIFRLQSFPDDDIVVVEVREAERAG